jgi:hypothetical protein
MAGIAIQEVPAGNHKRFLPAEIDGFEINTVRNNHGIPGIGGIDPVLDGGVVSRHMNDPCLRCNGECQNATQKEKFFHGSVVLDLLIFRYY